MGLKRMWTIDNIFPDSVCKSERIKLDFAAISF